MIADIEKQKPAQQLVVLDKYFRKFLKWALKLPLKDKLVLAKFMLTVQHAHKMGEQKAGEAVSALDESEHQGSPFFLPERSFIKHQRQKDTGASYGDLDSMLSGRRPGESTDES